MQAKEMYKYLFSIIIFAMLSGCKIPTLATKSEHHSTPEYLINKTALADSVLTSWRNYFSNPTLISLIDTALNNNQELNILLQEIEISKNEVLAKKGEYLPFVGLSLGSDIEKISKNTWRGGVEDNLKLTVNEKAVKSSSDFYIGGFASWELDIWKKLRNSKKAATLRYLSTIEGRNFMVTNIVAEIAASYVELLAKESLLSIIKKNIQIQTEALKVVRIQKESAKVTQLAVKRFEAQLLSTQNMQYLVQQSIIETENRIRLLIGKPNEVIKRDTNSFLQMQFDAPNEGLLNQLLLNRPDIRQAELLLQASKLEVAAARANFLPSFSLKANFGMQAFNPMVLIKPESILLNLAGDAISPLINKNAITAAYKTANAKQIQAIYLYEQSVLKAYLEVMNRLTNNKNYTESFLIKNQEVEILNQSIQISNSLFQSARADYAEVLLTQREALDAMIDLVEIKLKQVLAQINLYKALGGGWK